MGHRDPVKAFTRLFFIWLAIFMVGLCLFGGQKPQPAYADGTCYSTTPPSPEPYISFLHSCGLTTYPTPIPFPTLGVNVLNTPGINVVNPIPTPTVTAAAAISTPAGSGTSITLLAANPGRNGYSICNESLAIMYMAKAATASATAYSIVFPPTSTTATCYVEMGVGIYKGVISGIWASANGNARVTEW